MEVWEECMLASQFCGLGKPTLGDFGIYNNNIVHNV
jgi:hypothetical protein